MDFSRDFRLFSESFRSKKWKFVELERFQVSREEIFARLLDLPLKISREISREILKNHFWWPKIQKIEKCSPGCIFSWIVEIGAKKIDFGDFSAF